MLFNKDFEIKTMSNGEKEALYWMQSGNLPDLIICDGDARNGWF